MPAAAPNEKVQVSMELTAPAADGTYAGYFTLHNSNGEIVPIGAEKTFWVKFMVGAYAIIPTASEPTRRNQEMESQATATRSKCGLCESDHILN